MIVSVCLTNSSVGLLDRIEGMNGASYKDRQEGAESQEVNEKCKVKEVQGNG